MALKRNCRIKFSSSKFLSRCEEWDEVLGMTKWSSELITQNDKTRSYNTLQKLGPPRPCSSIERTRRHTVVCVFNNQFGKCVESFVLLSLIRYNQSSYLEIDAYWTCIEMNVQSYLPFTKGTKLEFRSYYLRSEEHLFLWMHSWQQTLRLLADHWSIPYRSTCLQCRIGGL